LVRLNQHMLPSPQSRGPRRLRSIARTAALGFPLFAISSFLIQTVHAQSTSPADNPASIPAGAIPPLRAKPQAKPSASPISPKQAREADDAYLEGAKHVQHKDLAAAVRSFEQAVRLDPNNSDYSLSLIVTRENYVTELVQRAARARSVGDTALADSLLAQARTLDPNNHVVTQHFGTASSDVTHPANVQKGPGLFYSSIDPSKFPAQGIASTLSGPVELTPDTGERDVHLHGDVQSVARNLYSLYGIKVSFDSSVTGGRPINLDMNKVTYAGATRALDLAGGIFSVPVQPKTVLVAKDTQENRDALMPQVEETIYLPGRTNDEMQQLANVARNIFDIKEVTSSASGGFVLLRGNEQVLREVNAVYDDMLVENPEVLFDVTLYEIDKSVENNIGAALPSSLNGFDVLSSAQNLITSNQSLINQAVASGLLTLTGSTGAQELAEVAFLIAAGVSGASEFTTLLGVVGTDGGLPLAGVSVASGGTFDLGLISSDVRLVDAAQVRAGNRQQATFRVGSRYPVVTGTYSSGATSSLASSLSGLNINGTSASSLLSQFLGSNTTTVPEFQYEDLGITLKLTPQVLHNDEVSLAVDMKIEALGGTSLNNIPILNNRTLTSTITVPAGKTAMLATLVTTNELKGLTGLPGLSELPGFQGTEQDLKKSTTELLITVTPHIARAGRIQIASRRLAAVRTGPSSNMGSDFGIGSDSGTEPARRTESGRGSSSGMEPGSIRGPGQGANQNPGGSPPQ
jgi:general secretion pathway protein D